MRRIITIIVLVVAAVSFLAFRPATTTDATAVEGVWKSVHVTITNDEGTEEREITQPNLLIYTGSHYATIFVVGQEPRAELPEDPTDEQLLAAWRQLRANAGTYEVKGNEIHTKVTVAKNPNATAEQAENSVSFEVDGDTLVQTFTNDAGTFKLVVKFARVE